MTSLRQACPSRWVRVVAVLIGVGATGCSAHRTVILSEPALPKELKKVSMPEYVLEAPDTVKIDLVSAVPKPPYVVRPLDALAIRVDRLPDGPLGGVFPVDVDGTVALGGGYGSAAVAGKTIDQVRADLETFFKKLAKDPQVDVSLAQGRAMEQVRGTHLVRPDGSVGLGSYGSVWVAGKTIAEAKRALEAHLGQYFQTPEISLDVTGFNSKVYYVVTDGGNAGTTVQRLPVTGNETVLDALGTTGGVGPVSDTRMMWIARPAPECQGFTKLPVDWKAITECGDVATNYQLLPGDRLFVKAYPSIAFQNRLERLLAPLERITGFTLLGVGAQQAIANIGNNSGGFNNNNNNNGFGGF
jgi:polysaccharide export outer membrane protein